jgi:hypothetical protein
MNSQVFQSELSEQSMEHSLLLAKQYGRREVFLNPRLKNAIAIHIVRSMCDRPHGPLLLVIQGPAGEGKTFQAKEICFSLGIDIVSLPGSSLGGEHEKEPVHILRNSYVFASDHAHATDNLSCLLIDDLDTSIVSTKSDRKYTANSQLLSGAMMHLCDNPHHVNGKRTYRIPIIVTGNDFTSLHKPLVRRGRAVFCDWSPTLEEKVAIVQNILQDIIQKEELHKVESIVKHFSFAAGNDEPVAFYEQIRQDAFDEMIIECLSTNNYSLRAAAKLLNTARLKLKADDLMHIAEKRQASRAKNKLNPEESENGGA